MTKIKYKNILIIFQIIAASLIFIGCNKEQIDENSKLELNKGAFVDENDNYKTFNLSDENSYEEINTEDKIINNFNMNSNTYTFYKENNFYINYNSEDIKIEHSKIANLKISPDGNYAFYFINDEYLVPVVMELKDKKEILLDNKAIISGQFIDWITDGRLAFYGVDTENKTTGIFTYDIKSKEEENIYNISNGYVKFLKHIEDGLALVEEHYEEETVLKIINVNGTVNEISKEVVDINDIESIDGKIYLLGRVKNNNYSIYEIDNGIIKRLLFDFPSVLYAEKGLSVNEAGEILFVGSTGNNQSQNIYKYSNGSVALVLDTLKSCDFININ